jgi:HEPN domain-containing protein
MKKENFKQAKEWFVIGDDELGYAQAAFNDFDDFYGQMCVQAHQAIEKYLKGFLVYHDMRYPRTHDLTKLIKDCAKIDKKFLDFLDDCNKIADYYIELRYPVHYRERTKEEAGQAIEIARSIVVYVESVTFKITDED